MLNRASHFVRTPALAGILLVATFMAHAEVILVGGEDGYQPYETLNASGDPVGFNVDLMRAIGRASGHEVRFRLGSWDSMRDALQSGEIDVLGMFVSSDRRDTVDFARPHIIVHHRIFIPVGGDAITRIDELAGKSVIVQREAWSHEFLLDSGLDVELVLVDSDSEGLRLLAQNHHDAALLTEHRSRHTMRQTEVDNLTVSGPPVLPVEYAFAVREGNEEMLAVLNNGLDEVMASGEFDRIYEHWLQPLDRGGVVRFGPGQIALLVLGGLLLVGAFAWLVWKLLRYRRTMHQARVELAYLREHDALTGLMSRSALENRLAFLCGHHDSGKHSLLNINVDQFRLINETLGHSTADRLLKAIGLRLRELLPADAAVARLGADEFAVLLHDTGEETALAAGRMVLASLKNDPLDVAGKNRAPTLSIGVVTFVQPSDGIETILRRADCACLAAKEDGGNQVHSWHPDDQRLAEKFGELGWVARIQSALQQDRLAMHWQSIVPLQGPPFRTVAVEILVRMLPEDPGDDPIAAGRFMPAAERYFMTSQIDRWVLTSVLDWMRGHARVIDQLDRVNVNLSGRSLGDQHFLIFLKRTLDMHRSLLPKLCLEVTETALISNLEQARQVLEHAHSRGCRIALDDFGTGVSSMNYLRQLPVDYLKIDGSFVNDIDRDSEAFEFISEINRLGQAMDKITIAECVETEAVRAQLQRLGVDLMQGYLVDKPSPLDSLPKVLAQRSQVAGSA